MNALAPLARSFDPARYEAVCASIATLDGLDEIKGMRDQADALRVLAHQARNLQPEIALAEIRIRAERRLGEILAGHSAAGLIRPGNPSFEQRAATRGDGTDSPRVKLAELGIDERFADRCRKYAALAADDFLARLAERRQAAERGGRVSVRLDLTDKAERRAAREAELGARVAALPDKRYGVILADPEWEMDTWSSAGLDRAASNHYPTSDLATLCARDVASIAAPDCVLALWALVPMLAEAFCVLDAWGFSRFERDDATGFLTLDKRSGRYASSGCWTKHKPGAGIGMGHWFRVDHELLLIATRGRPPAPAPGTQARSVFDTCRSPEWLASRIHSQKPELVAEILEGYFPSVPKIELNRRGPPRPGWDAWGNEADNPKEAAA